MKGGGGGGEGKEKLIRLVYMDAHINLSAPEQKHINILLESIRCYIGILFTIK